MKHELRGQAPAGFAAPKGSGLGFVVGVRGFPTLEPQREDIGDATERSAA